MEHAAHLVDVLDTDGKIIGQKKRRAINKEQDIYHAIYVIVVTPKGELVLGVIPPREDLPNLYARQFGTPMATIRRHNETPLQAATRGVSRELFIDVAELTLLGEKMLHLPDGRQTYVTAYYMIADAPSIYSVIDIDTLAVASPRQLRNMIENSPQEIAPTMQAIWQAYSHALPI